ncbi:glycoside hydrolase family 3 N-terminal domain-containing protein [Microlunatus ginsengisoli]|uniref:beta-glucosidase n=1 Tax=Microlunatus ginsengisoli TaxID=363863 RepID=A0ABP7AGA2_9ACTN
MTTSTRSQTRRGTADIELETRIDALLAALTVEEKVGQLHLAFDLDPEDHREEIAAGLVGAGIYSHGANDVRETPPAPLAGTIAACQRIAREESRLGIPLLFGSDVVHGMRTTLPIPLGLAATWDTELVREAAARAAAEASAEGLHLTFAPMVDISAEHRWGRIGETLGGEPQLTSRMGAALVHGFQSDGRFGATAKHFVGYGLVDADRDQQTLSIGPNALHNVHLRPFRAAVEAGCRAIMVGLHDVDAIPMHAHRRLIRDLLKREWGFTGVVTSDWDGIGQLVDQGIAEDLRDAARQAMLAGVDLDMVSGAYRDHLPELVAAGDVELWMLDDAVRRVLRLKFRAGLFDAGADPAGAPAPLPVRRDTMLARRAAAASMVLLKNADILPLHSNLGVIHLCGPFVEDAGGLLGSWVYEHGEDTVTPADALAAQLDPDELIISDGRFADLAVRHADAADVTVALVGEHPSRSGEDRCLPTAELPVGQLELLRELASLGKPLVVVVAAARPLELRPVLQLADAVLLIWHPGAEAGPTLADVLLGHAAPTGRLPMSLPQTNRTPALGTIERTIGRRLGRSRDTSFGRYLNSLVNPELTLGFGLTYTSFAYSDLELSRAHLPMRAGVVRASVEVVNTGFRPGREVVQLYLRDLVADIVRPQLELADWRAIELDPGRSTRVTFKITPDLFAYTDRELRRRIDPGAVDVIIGPNAALGSSARLLLG